MESSRLAEFKCEISPGYDVRQKNVWLSIIPARRQWPATTHKKRCELQLIFAAIGQAVHRWKALNLGSLSMQFQQKWPKDKKLQLFNFFKRKLRTFSR